ncbi:MAG: hypothetical protein QNJ69_06060 [Gammaproteobacteria bacterium]|nr:hypothetical protein [Gammaproteobacteria bacterium]
MQTSSQLLVIGVIATAVSACASDSRAFTAAATGEVITDMKARATGGGGSFDGSVDNVADLDDLMTSAWGVDWLGSHRGHSPIERVLERFLGISHDRMHYYMEQRELNLAGVCQELGLDPGKLVESLTNSFAPYVDEAVVKGIIPASDATAWIGKVREQFQRRVYWQG